MRLYFAAATIIFSGTLLCNSVCASVTISTRPNKNIQCSGGVCQPTEKDAVLNKKNLEQMLASSNVKVTTGGESLNYQVKDIVVAATVTWSSTRTLVLDAYRSIIVNRPVALTGSGGLTVVTNDGGVNGVFSFGSGGGAQFYDTSGVLTINGSAYTLVANITSLATEIASNPTGLYALANSYDASGDGTYSNSPILTTLTGTFEGLGNQIYNLSIANNSLTYINLGLFSQIGSGGQVRNLSLSQVNVEYYGQGSYVGTVVGANEGQVTNVHATGTSSASTSAYPDPMNGGLVGNNGGTIAYSYSDASTEGPRTGGIVGLNTGTIVNSYNTGSVAGPGSAAGVAAENDGMVQYSFSTGDIGGGDVGAGGLVAVNTGYINQCYATGSVSSQSPQTGGLVGLNSGGSISQTYATGSSYVETGASGGLLGYNDSNGDVSESYSIGAVSGGQYVGGFVGFDNAPPGAFHRTYWDTDTSGVTNSDQGAGNVIDDPGIKAKTTEQLQAGLPKGFSRNVWKQSSSINNGFPYLAVLPPN